MKRQEMYLFNPTVGKTYKNNGAEYKCIGIDAWGAAKMKNTVTGWTLIAHGVYMLDDATQEIEWDFSTHGHFE